MTKSDEAVVIGRFFLNSTTLELRGDEGVVPLRAKAAEVLGVLARDAGRLVTKDRLMETVWPDTFVTDDSLVQCVSEIRRTLGPDAGAVVVTVKGRGYRLEIAGGAGEAALPAPEPAPEPAPVRRRRGVVSAVFLLLLAAAVAGGVAWLVRPTVPGAPQVLAVLPFRNDGPDDDGYFADGVAEDLIVALSRIGDLRVISRGTSFQAAELYRSQRELSRALGADVLLEGSVRRRGGTLLLTSALVDGATGETLWADRYEGDTSDIFRFQEDVLGDLLEVLSVRLSPGERARLGIRGTRDAAAHDAYLQGRKLENLFTRRDNLAAERALREAISRDPDFALAHAHLAQVMTFRVENGWSTAVDRDIGEAFASAERALELDPDLPFGHFVLGRLYTRFYAHDLADSAKRSVAQLERAIALDPNYADAYVFLALVHSFNGDAKAGLPLIEEGFRRNPLPPFWYYLARGQTAYQIGDYAAAETALIRARDQNPTAPFPHRYLIATLGQLGRPDDAQWAAVEYEALGRRATVSAIMDSASTRDPASRARLADGLRKAGLPED